MPDEAFNRQRRCLNTISIVLIIYFITGVEFGQGAMVIGSFAISIKHEIVAFTLVWTAFIYFWWRFYLFGENVQRRWKMDFLYQLSKDEKYRKLYAQPESSGQNNQIQNNQMVWAPSMHAEGFRRYLSWEEAYLVGIKAGDGQIQFADPSTFSESVNPANQKWGVGPETIIPLKWRKYFFPSLKAIVSAMISKNGTEWVLPNFLACIALICGIVSLITIVN